MKGKVRGKSKSHDGAFSRWLVLVQLAKHVQTKRAGCRQRLFLADSRGGGNNVNVNS